MPKKLDFWAFCRDLKRIIFASVLCVFCVDNVAFGASECADGNCQITYYCYGALNSISPPLHGASNPQSYNASGSTNIMLASVDDVCVAQSGFSFDTWRCEYTGYNSTFGPEGIIRPLPAQSDGNGNFYLPRNSSYTFPWAYIRCYSEYKFNDGAVIELIDHCGSSLFSDFLYVKPGTSRGSGVYKGWSQLSGFADKLTTSGANPASVPQSTCFVGYTSDSAYYNNSDQVCKVDDWTWAVDYPAMNSYGELLSGGDSVARALNLGDHENWYARYLSPTIALKLESFGADDGQHGQEFLYYNCAPNANGECTTSGDLRKFVYETNGSGNYSAYNQSNLSAVHVTSPIS